MFGAGLRGRPGPPVPDGHPAPHRPRPALLVHRRLAVEPRHGPRPVAVRALHRSRTCSRRSTGPRSSTGPRASSSSTTCRTSSPASTPTSPRRSRIPTLLPAEYAALGKTPQPWTPTDVIAEASLIGGIFGKGGGRELESAQTDAGTSRSASAARPDRRAWVDFRSKNDPEAPTTVSQRFPYQTASAFSDARPGAARPGLGRAGARGAARLRERRRERRRPRASASSARSFGAPCKPGHASNWELVSARESRTGHPIGVLGPQVGYYVPQILMEIDIHGPGHRRPRRDLPRRQPLRAARPRPRLRVERDHGHLRQRRHLRRGPLPRRLPLPLQGPVPGDGAARPHQLLDAERGRLDARRLGDPDRLPHRARHRLRARQGGRQEGRLRERPHDLLPRGRLGARSSRA